MLMKKVKKEKNIDIEETPNELTEDNTIKSI